MIPLASATGSGGTTFTMVMDHVAQGFEVLGAAVLVVGVVWSIVLAAIAWRRSGRPRRAYEALVAADLIRTVAVAPSLTNVLVLGIIVLIRTFLSISLETEIEGAPPWRRATASGVGTVQRATSTALGPDSR